jgi:hypothetical protein
VTSHVSACRDAHLKRYYLPADGTVAIVLECQRQSGHTGTHAALWLTGCVTWQYST